MSGRAKGKGSTEGSSASARPLTTKRQFFVEAYLGRAGGNATEAARLAGYSKPMQEGYRLLRNAEIAVAVAVRLENAKRCLSADDVLEQVSGLALSADRDSDRLTALALMGKHHRLFTDRVERPTEETAAEQAKADAFGAVAAALDRIADRQQEPK